MDLYDAKFLFDNQLIAALEKLIRNSKNELLLISPFIDLDNRIKDALKEKIDQYDFELRILFGKNELNYFKSINPDSFKFLKEFPNIEIRYNHRLHAKFYLNDFTFLMTSLNLYNYSLANNIESGIIIDYAPKGLVGRLIESADKRIAESTDKFKKNIFGISKDEEDPIQKFERIYETSEIVYKTSPILVDQTGLKGMLGAKKITGFTVDINQLEQPKSTSIGFKPESKESNPIGYKYELKESKSKKFSASQLSKIIGKSAGEITSLMQRKGLIADNEITVVGLKRGLEMKNYMGKNYIAYPENLDELDSIK